MEDMEKKLAFLLANSPHFMLKGGSSTYRKAAKDFIVNGVVVRERGEWVYDHWCEFKCSKCGTLSKTEPRGEENFCPNCGVDMRKRECVHAENL